jgi:hypothetical protein
MTAMMMGMYNRKKIMEMSTNRNIANTLNQRELNIGINRYSEFNNLLEQVTIDSTTEQRKPILNDLRRWFKFQHRRVKVNVRSTEIWNQLNSLKEIDNSRVEEPLYQSTFQEEQGRIMDSILDTARRYLELRVEDINNIDQIATNEINRESSKNRNKYILGGASALIGGAFYGVSNMLDNFDINSIYNSPKSLIHVGTSLCLDDTVGFTNINNLIKIVATDSTYILKDIENQLNPNSEEQKEIYELLQSKEFRSMIITGSLKCSEFTKDLEDQDPKLLSRFILNNIKDLSTYTDKCNILKPLLLDEYFKALKISENPKVQDYALSVLSGIYINTIKTWDTTIPWSPHSLHQYKINVDKLVDMEIATQTAISVTMNQTDKVDTEGRAIPTINPIEVTSKKGEIYQDDAPFNTTPLGNKQILENKRNEYISLPPIEAIYLGNFDSFSFIEY